MESPLILMYFHFIFLWPLGDQRVLTCLWDVCPALAKMHTLPTCTQARVHTRTQTQARDMEGKLISHMELGGHSSGTN